MRDNLPKMTESASAPSDVTTQPAREMGPKAAREAGSRKMPEPIMLPTTSAVQAASPRPPAAAPDAARTSDCAAAMLSATGRAARGSGRRRPGVRAARCHGAEAQRPDDD